MYSNQPFPVDDKMQVRGNEEPGSLCGQPQAKSRALRTMEAIPSPLIGWPLTLSPVEERTVPVPVSAWEGVLRFGPTVNEGSLAVRRGASHEARDFAAPCGCLYGERWQLVLVRLGESG